MAHGRNLFYRLSTSGLFFQLFGVRPLSIWRNLSALQNRQANRTRSRRRKNSCNRKTETKAYLGLRSGANVSLRNLNPEIYGESALLCLRGSCGSERNWDCQVVIEASKSTQSESMLVQYRGMNLEQLMDQVTIQV